MKGVLTFLLGLSLSSSFAGGIVSTLDHASLEAAIGGGGLVQIVASGTIHLTNTISIDQTTSIESTVPNVVIDGGGRHRAFSITGGAIALHNLTISNCNPATIILGFTAIDKGGAIIVSNATLKISNSHFSNNKVDTETAGQNFFGKLSEGGAIWATGSTVALTNVVFQNNEASAFFSNDGSKSLGGAIFLTNSAIFADSCYFLANSTRSAVFHPASSHSQGGAISFDNSSGIFHRTFFTKNTANSTSYALGGAVNQTGSTDVRFVNCVFSSNSVFGDNCCSKFPFPSNGGAIANSSKLSVINCYFSDNRVEAVGKASGGAISNTGDLEVMRSTFRDNQSRGGAGRSDERSFDHPGQDAVGGAIFSSKNLNLEDCTFSDNAAFAGNAAFFHSFILPPGNAKGGAVYAEGTLKLSNTTFATNNLIGGISDTQGNRATATNGFSLYLTNAQVEIRNSIFSGQSPQLHSVGEVSMSASGNLISDGAHYLDGSLTNINPNLGAIGYYGGYTPTIPLLSGSPAINFGPVALTNSIDQRYYLRATGEAIDSGAFEFYPWGQSSSTIPTSTVSVQTSHHDSTGEVNFSQGILATGALLVLEATPGPNSGFLGWTGGVTSKSPQLFLIVTQDLQITANFAILRTVTVSNSNPSAGAISLTNAVLPEGETVSVSATPIRAYRFVGWTGTYNNSDNPFIFTLEADTQLTAVFEQSPSYTVTAGTSGPGTVSPSTTNVFEGETVTLTASPNSGAHFSGWTGDVNSSQNPLVITVTSNINLTANFQSTLFRLHFHDNTGLFAHWDLNLETVTHSQLDWPLGQGNRMPAYWQLASAADRFNRWDDGEAYLDLLWSGQQGEVAYWQVDNQSLQMASGQVISGPANRGAWTLAAGPYFDSAATFGLLWQNPATGNLATWFGTNMQSRNFLPANSGWELIQARDFDSDGNADFLWQHNANGQVALWRGNQPFTSLNANLASNATLLTGQVPGWRVVDLVDLNADNQLDLLWQNKQTGGLAVWLLNNLQLPSTSSEHAFLIPKNGAASFHNPGPQWRVFSVKTSY